MSLYFRLMIKVVPFIDQYVFVKGIRTIRRLPARLFHSSAKVYSYDSKNKCYFNKIGQRPLLSQTVGQVLDESAEQYGQNEAVVVCETNLRKNYIDFKQDADKFAAGLLALGLNRGDRIGIWSPNNYEWVLTQFAAAKAGLILVNINPAYQPRELDYCLEKVGMRVIVSAELFKNQNYYEMLKNVIPSLPSSTPGNIRDKFKNLTHIIMLSDKSHPGAFTFSDVFSAAQKQHFDQLEDLQSTIHFDDPVNIQFTSGTTGSPKGVVLSHFNIVNNASLIGRKIRYHEKRHRICLSVPFHHCFGCVMGSLTGIMHGACLVLPSPTFNALASAKAVHNEKCTSLYGTPTMFIDVLNLPDLNKYSFSSAETGIMAGSTCPIEIVKSVMTKLNARDFTIGYGCTESSPVVTQTSIDDSIEKRAETVGTVMEHTELQLINPTTGSLVELGEVGEVWVRGYMVMSGYWEDEEKTKECITRNRWYKTGDLAIADEDGYIKIVGRIKDMVIRGGENIYPREIEEFLHLHPKIAQVQVVGVPDKRMGEELCAWINLKQGETLTENEVKQFCKNKLAHFKIPKYIKFVDNFPTTATGKVQKYVIKEKATTELGLK